MPKPGRGLAAKSLTRLLPAGERPYFLSPESEAFSLKSVYVMASGFPADTKSVIKQ